MLRDECIIYFYSFGIQKHRVTSVDKKSFLDPDSDRAVCSETIKVDLIRCATQTRRLYAHITRQIPAFMQRRRTTAAGMPLQRFFVVTVFRVVAGRYIADGTDDDRRTALTAVDEQLPTATCMEFS